MKLPSIKAIKAIIYLVLAATLISNLAIAQGSSSTGSSSTLQSAVQARLCGIISFVQAVVGTLAVVLFILGGVLYAVGHFLPATGNVRASMQGWAMGMLMAAIIALILFIIANPIVTMIAGFGSAAGGGSVSVNCSSSGSSASTTT